MSIFLLKQVLTENMVLLGKLLIKTKSGRHLAEKQCIAKRDAPHPLKASKQGFPLPWPLCEALPLVSREDWYKNCTAAWACIADEMTRMRSRITTPRKSSNAITKHTGSDLAALFQCCIFCFLKVVFSYQNISADFPKGTWQARGDTESKDPLSVISNLQHPNKTAITWIT